MNQSYSRLITEKLKDKRSKRVIFFSHCILNQNTRYQGGAFCSGIMNDVVKRLLCHDYGIVQVACPERMYWGGVSKKIMLFTYGLDRMFPKLRWIKPYLATMFILYSKLFFSSLARRTVQEMADYLEQGYEIIGFIGVDSSPTCGVNKSMDLKKGFCLHAALDPENLTPYLYNNELYNFAGIQGYGLFIERLKFYLKKRGIEISFSGIDLLREKDEIQQEYPVWL